MTRRSKKPAPPPLRIAVDTREQLPYDFLNVKKPYLPFDPRQHVYRRTLNAGDYSAIGFQERITIERKSLADAYGSFGTGRDRFEAEIVRMEQYEYAAVIIEAQWDEILLHPPKHSKRMKPKTIVASVVAWEQRHGVRFHAVPGRGFAEQLTYRIIERFVRDRIGTA